MPIQQGIGRPSYSSYYGRRKTVPTYSQPDREQRETARTVLRSVTGGERDREEGYARQDLINAKAMAEQQAKKDAAANAAIKKSRATEIAAGQSKVDAQKAGELAKIREAGMKINGIPVIEDGKGGVKYDVNAIGQKVGLSPEEIQQASNVTFGKRELTTGQKFDDLLGTGQNAAAKQSGRMASKEALKGRPEITMLNNIAQLDPMEARLDFQNEDHLINLAKDGYFSDVSKVNQRERLDASPKAGGIGKHAQVYLPMAVQAFASMISPAAGVAMGALFSAKDVAQDNKTWGEFGKDLALSAGTAVAGSYLGAAAGGAMKGANEGTGIMSGISEGMSNVDLGLSPYAATQGMGPSALEINQGPGYRGGSLSEMANQAAMQEAGQFGGLGGNLNQGAYQGTPTGVEVTPQFGDRPAGIEELGGPYRSTAHDPFSADPIGAPIERLTDPMDNLSPEELLAKVATGQGTLSESGQFIGIPGTSDPLSGVITPQLDAGGQIPVETGEGFQVGLGDLASLVGNVGLPILSDLFGKDPKTKKKANEYLESGLSDIGSESTGEDPFSEMQMISAGIR